MPDTNAAIGDAHTTVVTNNQTRTLLVTLAPYIAAGLLAAVSWLQSVGTSHEVSLKEAIQIAAKEIIASQQKQTEVIKADVKAAPPATPVIVAPPPSATAVQPKMTLEQWLERGKELEAEAKAAKGK